MSGTTPAPDISQHATSSTNAEFPSQAVLQRMKEMENQLSEALNKISALENDNNNKDNQIKKLEKDKDELSAERKREMEQIVETAINDWLMSLKDISEDVRAQFKTGIYGLAKNADIKNHAWEVICNASQAHKENVQKIEELVKLCNEKEKTIETLLTNNNDPSFRTMASRVSNQENVHSGVIPNVSFNENNKRPRTEDHVNQRSISEHSNTNSGGNNDAWDHFAKMISDSARQTYF